MAKQVFGEYSAYVTPGGIRFQKNNKLVSEKSVPPEVVAFLTKKLTPIETPEPPKFPPPTEEEKAKLRAESLQVPVELQRSDEEMEAARPKEPTEVPPVEEPAPVVDPLTADDFDDEPTPAEAPLPSEPEVVEHPTEKAVRQTKEEMADFMEQVSIHTAPIEDIAEALYNRFGIYSVYLNRLPVHDEVNPLTGEPFSKYHLGIAYQAAIRAQNQGILHKSPEQQRAILDKNRAATATVDTPPQTMGDARRADSFAFRTSVRSNQTEPTTEIVHEKDEHGVVRVVRREIPEGEVGKANGANQRYDADEEAPIVEPAFGKKVIRPNW